MPIKDGKGRPKKIDVERAIALYKELGTLKKVAEAMGVSVAGISNNIREWEKANNQKILKKRGGVTKFATPMSDRERAKLYRQRLKQKKKAAAIASRTVAPQKD